MSTYSLRHDDASPSPLTQTLEAWGISNCVVKEPFFQPGTLSFDIAGDFDAAEPFAYGDRVTLLEGSTVRWTGRIRQMPATVAGNTESRRYVAEDVLGDLARRTLFQLWQVYNGSSLAEASLTALVLFRDAEGGALTIGAQIEAIVDAAAAAGVEVQFGTASGMLANPQAVEAKAVSYLEALKLVARFTPDACPQIDHTTTPPTLSFVRRADATERSLAVIESADEFEITPLNDQQVSGVHITYRTQATFLGQSYVATTVEKYPLLIDGNEENTLVIDHDLRPAVPPNAITQNQYIETVLIEPGEFDFWELLWPDLADRNEAATLEDGEIVGDPDEDRMIIAGAQPEWTGSAAIVEVRALFNGVINGVTYVNKQLVAKVNASTLTTNTYSRTQAAAIGDPGESVPTGLAESLYDAMNPLQWTGRHVRTASELDWTVKVGDVLNFTGTDIAAHATARASVQSITRVIDGAVTTLELGPAPWLQFNDFIDVLHMQKVLLPGDSFARAGNPTSATLSVDGAGMGPGFAMIPTETLEMHPFRVTRVGTTGNDYRVQSGQIDGYTIPSQTVDVGATRPVAIRIVPKYTVSQYNDEFVYAAILDTSEGNEPLLEASTTISDVNLITDAGDEGRKVIATIDSVGAVSQIAESNLLSEINDDGSLTAQAEIFWS